MPDSDNAGSDRLVVAIDGPAGVGKSTVAQMVAAELSYAYIDTGAMYRAVTFKALRKKVNTEDDHAVAGLAREALIEERYNPTGRVKLRTFLDGREVTREIRTPRVSNYVSRVSANPGVRTELVKLQRRLLKGGGVVIEGRDMGTIVAPDADIKIFLTASVSERARRRHGDLLEAGIDIPLETLRNEIARRDHADSTRKESPLSMARDALRIDTTGMNAEEVAAEIVKRCRKKEKGSKAASRRS